MTGGVALIRTPGPGAWAAHGACRDADPALFFPKRGGDLEPARAICAHCPVVEACGEYAIGIAELHGVWGGLSESERRRIRRRRALEAAAAQAAAAQAAATHAKGGALYATLVELAGHPQRWAIVAHFTARGSAATTASLLRTGRRPLPSGGTWEIEGRRNTDGGSDLWARFTPADQLDLAAGQ